MGNLFSSSADKEIKRLTKKNTKVNRDVLHQHDEDDVSIDGDIPALKKSASLTFVRTVKGVMYDREDGQIEVVEEPLNSIGVDGDDEECEMDPVAENLRPSTAPERIVEPHQHRQIARVQTGIGRGAKGGNSSPTAAGILRRRVDENGQVSPIPRP